MALRQDVGLSWLIVVCVPVLAAVTGLIITPDGAAVPGRCRTGIDTRQPGPARADHRHPRRARVRARARTRPSASRGPTPSSPPSRRRPAGWMALMFPIGDAGHERLDRRRCCGSAATASTPARCRSGALTAFLTYLMQILMSVMMATFMLVMIPRASVCADRIAEVLDTELVGRARGRADPHAGPARAGWSSIGVEFTYPGADRPGAQRRLVHRDTRARPPRSSAAPARARPTLLNLIPRLFDATGGVVRVDGIDVRELALETLWSTIGLVPQRPYLFSGTVAPTCGTASPTRPRPRCGRRSRPRRRATSSRRCRSGSTHRSPRAARTSPAASASGSRSRARSSSRPEIYLFDDCLLRARPRHRRAACAQALKPGHPARRPS